MSAGLREIASRVQQTRPDRQPVAQRLRVADIGTARVAHGREPALQHLRQGSVGKGREILGASGDQLQHVEVGRPDVHMRVDQPRHQGSTTDVDQIALGRPSYPTLGHLLDEPVGDQHLGAAPEIPALRRRTACRS
jgi:hypothetical protein